MGKNFMRANLSFLIPAYFIMATLFVPFGKSEEFVSYTKVGDKIPSFSLTTLDGKPFSIDTLKGKVVLVNFWATWCAPCLAEMPRIEKEIWQKRKGPDFEMIAIAREQNDQEIKGFRDKYNYSFPMGPDPKRGIYAKFANAGIPRNYVINPDGQIVYQSVGYSSEDFEKLMAILEKEFTQLRNRR
jgi:peroxiredoxin